MMTFPGIPSSRFILRRFLSLSQSHSSIYMFSTLHINGLFPVEGS